MKVLPALHRLPVIAFLDMHDVGGVTDLAEAAAAAESGCRSRRPAFVHQHRVDAFLALPGAQFL